MNVFEYVLAPFLYLIEQVFLLGYAITGNYGLSIVILSFIISILLLPVFILIEKSKKKDLVVKKAMQPFVDEIKRCYKGQERHYYLKTLNRQHNYNPLRSLIPTLSLLLQIPFFIAAYQFLAAFEPLTGVSFLFIKDLNLPDALFGSVNILPIAMTVVNLVTAYFYTRNGNLSELKQMVIVAAIFLVLLFNLPAGLVLYWTLNNVFSFFRLFITNPEAFQKNTERITKRKEKLKELKDRLLLVSPKLRLTFIAVLVIGTLLVLNEVLNNGFGGIALALMNVVVNSVWVTLSIAFLVLIHKNNIELKNRKVKTYFFALWPVFRTLFFILLLAMVGTQVNWALKFGFNSLAQRLVLAVLMSMIGTVIIAEIVLFYQGVRVIAMHKYRLTLSSFSKNEKKVLIGFISSFTIIQIVMAFFWGAKDVVLEITGSLIAVYLVLIVVINWQKFFTKERLNNIASITKQMMVSSTLFYSVLFLSAYFFLASVFYYTGVNHELNIVCSLITLFGQALGIYYLSKNKRGGSVNYVFKSGVIVLGLAQLLFVIAFLFGINFQIGNIQRVDNLLLQLSLSGFSFILFTVPYFNKLSSQRVKIPNEQGNSIFYISLLFLLSLVFFWNPLIVYSTFPETFSFPAIQLFPKNALHFIILFVIGIGLYLVQKRKVRYFLTVIFAALSFVFFLNIFVMPIKVGSLQMGQYIEVDKLAKPLINFIAEGVLLIALYIGFNKLILSGYNYAKKGLIVLFILVVGQSLITSISRGDFFSKETAALDLPETISFSKKHKNVIYIIPDTFMGMYLRKIRKDIPEAVDAYDGFVWYPNTLSVSTLTTPSISSLLLGSGSNLNVLNKDTEHTMYEKITSATEKFCSVVKDSGYMLTSTKMAISKIDKRTYDAYLPPWHPKWNKYNEELNIGGVKELDFAILWKNALFFGAPLFLKPQIYRDGKWIKVEEQTNKNSTLTQEHNFIRLLPYISDTNGVKGNFIYIHTKATHGPWNIVKDNGELVMNVTPYISQKRFIEVFANWITWMKENGVYDNTKIVMVSDHSHYLPDDWVEGFGGEYEWDEEGQKKLSTQEYWNVNALLLVKDFNMHGELKENWQFMSNSDAADLAFERFDTTQFDSGSRELPVFLVGAIPMSGTLKELPYYKRFLVKDNIFNSDNWTLIK